MRVRPPETGRDFLRARVEAGGAGTQCSRPETDADAAEATDHGLGEAAEGHNALTMHLGICNDQTRFFVTLDCHMQDAAGLTF